MRPTPEERPSQVTVVSPAPSHPPAGPVRPGGMALAVAGIVLAAVLVAVTGPQVATESASLAEDAADHVLVVPNLVGSTVAEARDLLRTAGFTRAHLISWVPDDEHPAGTVLAQSPGAGPYVDAPVEITVSSGGPTVSFGALPEGIRAVTSGVEVDANAPVLVLGTERGNAYVVGTMLFGSCEATDAARPQMPVTEVRCGSVATGATVGWLPDGTKFSVTGVPAAPHPPRGMAGMLMVDLPDGSTTELGVITASPVEGGGAGSPGVTWQGDERLAIGAGGFAFIVEVDAGVFEALGGDARTVLAEAIRPSTVDGYPILRLDPPLRWRLQGEIDDFLRVDFDSFSVIRGCRDDPCTPTVEVVGVPSGVDPASVELSVLVDPAEFAENGWVQVFQLAFPDGGFWRLKIETRLGMDVGGVAVSGRFHIDGEWVADGSLRPSDVWPLDERWDPTAALPQRLETHARADGLLAESWWLSPGSCCAYLTYVAAGDGRQLTLTSSALIDERAEFVESVVWAEDRVSFDTTRFSMVGLVFEIELVGRAHGQRAFVSVQTPCRLGLTGQAPCDRVDEVVVETNGLPITGVDVRPIAP